MPLCSPWGEGLVWGPRKEESLRGGSAQKCPLRIRVSWKCLNHTKSSIIVFLPLSCWDGCSSWKAVDSFSSQEPPLHQQFSVDQSMQAEARIIVPLSYEGHEWRHLFYLLMNQTISQSSDCKSPEDAILRRPGQPSHQTLYWRLGRAPHAGRSCSWPIVTSHDTCTCFPRPYLYISES